ncbi:MAG: NAD(P)/FAD-dependent oxidoreductase [Acidithiobacillus sp.]
MAEYDYLLIGAGPAVAAASGAIRSKDSVGNIGILGAEPEAPYQRPPLSKGLWLDKDKEADLALRSAEDWAALNVDLLLGDPVIRLDPQQRLVETISGKMHTYQKALLAMGGRARQFDLPKELQERVFTLRSLEDYRRLHTRATAGGEVAVIGGGFLGAELAAALSQQANLQVFYAVSGAGPLASLLSDVLQEKINARYRAAGVRLETRKKLSRLRANDTRLILDFEEGHTASCDFLVYAIGMEANIGLAERAGLKLANGGVAVDAQLCSSDSHIWVAGDLATYPDPVWGTPIRLEHWDNAEVTGHAAGLAMVGAASAFAHQSLFYSDLYEFGFEAIGNCQNQMECRTALSPDGAQAVVYYCENHQVHGVLLWNVWGKVDSARQLIAAQTDPGSDAWANALQEW